MTGLGLYVVVFIVVMLLASAIRILREYERGAIFRLGRLIGVKGPGLILLIPIVDKMVKVSLRVVTMDVPPQDVITRDNVTVKVNAVVYFRVMDPARAIVEVEDYLYATSQIAQTTLRSVLGEAEPIFDLDAAVSKGAADARELQALERAMEAESKTRALYAQQAESTSDPGAKAMWTKLADIEQTHLNLLTWEHDHIRGEGHWMDIAQFTMDEL